MTYKLYGGEISYFTGKVRAYLDYKHIPYEEFGATREVYQKIILPRVGWPVIPVVVTPEDDVLQDSSDIIDALEKRFPDVSVYPRGPRQRIASLLFELAGDEWLKLPAMHYRWNHNTDWIIGEFGKLSAPDASKEEQVAIGEKTCRPFRGSLPVLGVTDETQALIEKNYEHLLGLLNVHFERHPYLFGTRPSIGDFGLIGPLYAHQYRDPASGELMRRIAPQVAKWVERMVEPSPLTGDFLVADELPETAVAVLEHLFADYAPVLAATVAATQAWERDQESGTEVPRALGMHEFALTFGGEQVRAERAIFTFDVWMLQRVRSAYDKLNPAEQDSVADLLERCGVQALVSGDGCRLTRSKFKLVKA